MRALAIVSTHPVQYHAPVFRAVARDHGIAVKVIYGSDFSAREFFDAEFKRRLAWDVPLVTPTDDVTFLATVARGGAQNSTQVSARGLGRVLRTLQPAAVLVLGYQPRFYVDAIGIALLQRIPLLFRGETTDHAVPRNLVKRVTRDAVLRFLYARCAGLLPIGTLSRRHFLRLGVPESKLVDSPYCVDTTAFQTDESSRGLLRDPTREALGISPRQLAILFSGKLSPRKGPDLLLRAVASVSEQLRERAVVMFLGEGELRAALESQARDLSLNVRFLGFRNQTELSPYFHAADLFALPSVVGETWGLVVNEALHHGVPVVVSDSVGSAVDLAEPGVTGEHSEAGSVESLAAAIERAARLRGPDCRASCRARVEQFTVATAARGIAQAFKAITGRGERAPSGNVGVGLSVP